VDIQSRLNQYVPLQLKVDQSPLSASQRRMIPILIKAAQAMDEPFWIQNFGDRQVLLGSTSDPDIRRHIELNYGPWDRVHGNEPLMPGVGKKLPGANFYPADTSREEFEARAAEEPDLKSPNTMVRRNDQGHLVAIPYHDFFACGASRRLSPPNRKIIG
jgi:hypothetical protein